MKSPTASLRNPSSPCDNTPMRRSLHPFGVLGCAGLLALGACERANDPPASVPPAPLAPAVVIDFPDRLRATDPEVNEFLQAGIQICLARNYDEFRLLWVAKDDPMTKEDFLAAFTAVRAVRILALEKAIFETRQGDPSSRSLVHAVFAEADLDPAHPAASLNNKREIALMIIREHDRLRIANVPSAMREWIRQKAGKEPITASVDSPPPGPAVIPRSQ